MVAQKRKQAVNFKRLFRTDEYVLDFVLSRKSALGPEKMLWARQPTSTNDGCSLSMRTRPSANDLAADRRTSQWL